MTEKRSAVLSYMPQLDSLRSFAIFGVLITHFLQADDPLRSQIPWGWLGVRLFFVMSGFLVTGVLIACRNKIAEKGISPWRMIQNFYLRRCLRLFPVYYLYLAFALILHPEIRENIAAFIFYVQNFLFAVQPETFGALAHLWTMSIEAQFYLVLPWLVIFLPKRWLIPMLLIMALFSPVLRLCGSLYGFSVHQVNMMVPAHFDTLCLGGLLSALTAAGRSGRVLAEKLMSIGLWVGAPLLITFIVSGLFEVDYRISVVYGESGAGLFFVWLVGRASEGFKGLAGSVLNQRFLVYGGKISYGLYLFHFDIPLIFQDHLFPELNLRAIDNSRILFPVYVLIAVLIAVLSWKLVENPMNQQKRYFSLK